MDLLLVALVSLISGVGAPAEIVVAPGGSDANPGTAESPVATLAAARLKAQSAGAHTILVRAGRYRITNTVMFDEKDNGLTIIGEGKGRCVFTGGAEIPSSAIHPCTDQAVLSRIIDTQARSLVKEVDLKAIGAANLGPLKARGFPAGVDVAPNELFQNGEPCTLARWPNTGFAKVGKITEAGNGENDHDKPPRKPVFDAGERAKLWSHAEDPWLYGYWKYDWADESIKMDSVDANGIVTLNKPSSYGVAEGSPFFAENLLEELDTPGEYWIDRANSKLYFIEKESAGPKEFELSTLSLPILQIRHTANMVVRGLDFQVTRGDALSVQTCENVRIEGCAFKSIGERAALVGGGHKSGLDSCNISGTGEGGVLIIGGDRNTLSAGENFVTNCDIWDYERRSQTYRPAVSLTGDGNIVSHCAIHDAPHSAIIYNGNNHIIEYNEIYRTLTLTGDGGAIYTGRDWTGRGTQIRYNYLHDDVGQKKWEPAIYIDDLGSGIQAIGNLIERCHWGFLVGGGRDNVLEKNVLIDCDVAFDCDARGLGWAAKSKPLMMDRLKAVPTDSPAWKAAYPSLSQITTGDPMAPDGNVIDDNLLIRSGKVEDRMEAGFKKTVKEAGNIVTSSQADVSNVLPQPKSSMGLKQNALRALLK